LNLRVNTAHQHSSQLCGSSSSWDRALVVLLKATKRKVARTIVLRNLRSTAPAFWRRSAVVAGRKRSTALVSGVVCGGDYCVPCVRCLVVEAEQVLAW
jgi:hypothetical protein